jgi:hypothetical protein
MVRVQAQLDRGYELCDLIMLPAEEVLGVA